MSTTSQVSAALRNVLECPTRGVVGLVDDLLQLCRGHGLQLDWQADRCRVRCLADGSEEVIDSPLGKSVFRAVLARVAALCNEKRPNSVTPYGGRGKLADGVHPPTVFQVSFANTSDEQWLVLALDGPDGEAV
jgi:hypothetical protein